MIRKYLVRSVVREVADSSFYHTHYTTDSMIRQTNFENCLTVKNQYFFSLQSKPPSNFQIIVKDGYYFWIPQAAIILISLQNGSSNCLDPFSTFQFHSSNTESFSWPF